MTVTSSIRLYVDERLGEGEIIKCTAAQTHYLLNVVRQRGGETFAVFNGVDGEFVAHVSRAEKRSCDLTIGIKLRDQISGPDLQYIFAPLKRARLDYMVQKAVELGVSQLSPVMTQHTNTDRINIDRMRANVIEAAEQCGLMSLAEVEPPQKLSRLIETFNVDRHLIYCDEALDAGGSVETLKRLSDKPISVLIGPVGGFSIEERRMLKEQTFVTPLSLGPRIMRADTAAVAILSLVNGVLGDWG